jgi:hypothetical protein
LSLKLYKPMESIKDKIIGSWKLLSWTFQNEAGETQHYLGENPVGILMYDQWGMMNAQLMKSNRTNFASDAINGGSPEEMSHAFGTYLAYFGRYYEQAPGEIAHIVTGSLFPNWLGNKEVRYGKIEGDLLILSTPPIPVQGRETVFHIRWQRIQSPITEPS